MDEISLKEVLFRDLRRYTSEQYHWWSFCRAYFDHPGFRLTVWYRFGRHAIQRRCFRLLFPVIRCQYRRVQLKTGIQIPFKAEIGPGLYIPHFGGIVISSMFKAGQDLYLSHNVTVGKVHAGEKQGAPVCGDGVYLGAGAVLFGCISLGNNVAVGANSVVITDLGDDAFAAGAPARVVSMMGASGILGTNEVLSEKSGQ